MNNSVEEFFVNALAMSLCTHERRALHPWPCSACAKKAREAMNEQAALSAPIAGKDLKGDR